MWLSALGEFNVTQHYRLSRYSVSNLLGLLVSERAESIRLRVGEQPVMTVRGRSIEIEGPVVSDEIAEDLVRAATNTREMRGFRAKGTIDTIHTFDGVQVLIRAVKAFGEFRVDLRALPMA